MKTRRARLAVLLLVLVVAVILVCNVWQCTSERGHRFKPLRSVPPIPSAGSLVARAGLLTDRESDTEICRVVGCIRDRSGSPVGDRTTVVIRTTVGDVCAPVSSIGTYEALVRPGPFGIVLRCSTHDLVEPRTASAIAPVTTLDLIIACRLDVRGRVHDCRGEPVRALVQARALGFSCTVVTDELGRFEFRDLHEGTITVTAAADGFRQVSSTYTILEKGAGFLDINLDRGSGIRGRITNGSAAAQYDVTLLHLGRAVASTKADNCEFALPAARGGGAASLGEPESVTAGEYTVITEDVNGGAVGCADVNVQEGRWNDVQVALSDGCRLAGLVVDSNGQAWERGFVEARCLTTETRRCAPIGPAGCFNLVGLIRDSRYELVVSARAGGLPLSRAEYVVTEGSGSVTLRIKPCGRVRARVAAECPSGSVARVTLVEMGEAGARGSVPVVGSVVDEDCVPAGRYCMFCEISGVVTADSSDHVHCENEVLTPSDGLVADSQCIEVYAGGATAIELRPRKTASFRGHMVQRDGRPFPVRGKMRLYWDCLDVYEETLTDQAGVVHFPALTNGRYRIVSAEPSIEIETADSGVVIVNNEDEARDIRIDMH